MVIYTLHRKRYLKEAKSYLINVNLVLSCACVSPGMYPVGSHHRDLFALPALAFFLMVVGLFNGM